MISFWHSHFYLDRVQNLHHHKACVFDIVHVFTDELSIHFLNQSEMDSENVTKISKTRTLIMPLMNSISFKLYLLNGKRSCILLQDIDHL